MYRTSTSSAPAARPPATRPWSAELIKAPKAQGADDIVVVVGSVIPQQDYSMLKAAGVAAIYGAGTNILEAAREVRGLVRKAA